MTGTDLRIKRVAAHLKAKDVAGAMGITPVQISRLELRVGPVDPAMAQKYLDAVGKLTTNTTSGQAA